MQAGSTEVPSRRHLGDIEAELRAALERMGLLRTGDTVHAAAMSGGVSSDIWRIETPRGAFCVKRALSRLKVRDDWRAPVERNAYEVAWMVEAAAIVPGAAPPVLGHDPEAGLFAMEFLDPARHRLWKNELRAGHAESGVAEEIGTRLAGIHAGTAGRDDIAKRFATDRIFHAIRLEPYLEATARRHPDRAEALADLIAETARTRLALVHGDVSPKNIMLGPRGPVFLDAECAWYGDPAFDLAFCLNHLLLKCLWTKHAAPGFLTCFVALAEAYLSGVTFEPRTALERRAARLLPGLFLGRVDGKSPVEYLTEESDKDRVRRVARALLARPVSRLVAVRDAWAAEIGR